ncbi:MAG: MBL fold metallo-hydrolase [Candidatus Heimdallarchaeota archaeon]
MPIHVITGPTLKFPHSQTFIIESNGELLLADPGCGRDTLFSWLNQHRLDLAQIDTLLISHPHSDHISISKELVEKSPRLHVMAHKDAVPLIEDWEQFKIAFGDFSLAEWELWEKYVRKLTGFQNFEPVNETLVEGQKITVGNLTVEVLHTPGHAQGHLALVCPELSTLLPFDIDLTSFPWYGAKTSDLNDFVRSTKRLQGLEAKTVITSHHKPLRGVEISKSFENYLNKIKQRGKRIEALVSEGLTFEEIIDRAPIYGTDFRGIPSMIHKFEQVMVRMHLERVGLLSEVFVT